MFVSFSNSCQKVQISTKCIFERENVDSFNDTLPNVILLTMSIRLMTVYLLCQFALSAYGYC